jgi:hypothetical protein
MSSVEPERVLLHYAVTFHQVKDIFDRDTWSTPLPQTSVMKDYARRF